MTINNLLLENNSDLKLTFSTNDTDLEPYFLKRITEDNWKYFCGEAPLQKCSENVYTLNLFTLLDYVNPYKTEVFDLFLFKPCMCQKKSIVFGDLAFDRWEMTLVSEFCDLKLTLYRSGSNALSIKVVCTNMDKFKLKFKKETADELFFDFKSAINKPIELFTARRTTVGHELKYDTFIKIPFEDQHFVLPKKNLVHNIQNTQEAWDLIALCEGKYYTFVVDGDFSTEYFGVDDEYSAKLYISEGKYASIYVKRTGPAEQKKIKVSVFGSCFSREVFHAVDFFNKDYKKMYEVGLTGFHNTFVQLMNEPISYDHDQVFKKSDKFLERYADMLLSNTYMEQLERYTPDYLMIDVYVDSSARIIRLGDKRFCTRTFYLEPTEFFKNLDQSVYYEFHSAERFELYKDAVDRFSAYMQEKMPNVKIVVLRAWMSAFKMEDGVLSRWDDDKTKYLKFWREIYDRNTDYLISKLQNARVIDLRNDKYYTEKNPWLDFNFNHLNSQYYKDVLNELNKIVLQDMLKGDLVK